MRGDDEYELIALKLVLISAALRVSMPSKQ